MDRELSQSNRCYTAKALMAILLVSAIPSLTMAQNIPDGHPYVPVLKLAKISKAAVDQVHDYQAVLTKREMIGKKMKTTQMDIKVRHQPFSVYLKFRSPHEGREVLYVDGQNNNKLLAHEASGIASLVGTVTLDVNSSQAMTDNRYPVTMIGMQNLINKLITEWTKETQYGECEVKYYPNAKLGNVDCRVVETSHPQPRKQFQFQMTRLYVDKETNLPIRCEVYAFAPTPGQPPVLVEEYTYSNVRVNLGLTDFDFDRKNPNYHF